MERPSDPSDPTKPNRIARPVRPRALDGEDPYVPIPLAPRPAPAVRPPARRTAPAEPAEELSAPCRSCGYDLRGLPSGGRCPECGTTIPRIHRRIATSVQQQDLRVETSGAWRSFGITALAVIPLATPLPYLLPIGVTIAVALGFAPLFRLHALKRLRELPPSMRAPVDARLRALERWQRIETFCVALVGGFALVATFAIVPKSFAIAYPILLAIWWLIALEGIVQILVTGDALAGTLIDRSVLPLIQRPVRAARLAQVTGGLGFLANIAGSFGLSGSESAKTAALVAMVGLGFIAFAGGTYACIVAAGHTTTVGDCIYEAEIFRTRNADDEPDEGPLLRGMAMGDSEPPPPPPNAKPSTWEDEERIPLA